MTIKKEKPTTMTLPNTSTLIRTPSSGSGKVCLGMFKCISESIFVAFLNAQVQEIFSLI